MFCASGICVSLGNEVHLHSKLGRYRSVYATHILHFNGSNQQCLWKYHGKLFALDWLLL